jgi:transcriptional regulator with XRE-family HTH domain
MNTKNMVGIETLEAEFGPMTAGLFLRAMRDIQGMSQLDLAKKLKISKAHLCDIEKGRRLLSPDRAAKFAKIIKAPESVLIQLALQDSLREAKLNYFVKLTKAS